MPVDISNYYMIVLNVPGFTQNNQKLGFVHRSVVFKTYVVIDFFDTNDTNLAKLG